MKSRVVVIVFVSLFIYLNADSQDLFNQKVDKALPFPNFLVTLSPSPLYVRYAWADSPPYPNLYNKEGLPASPFRTDNF